ncbi:hypothetical protein Tco_0461852 [Tanacetum coccineum]
MVRDKAKGSIKKKGPRSSGSSSTNDKALARLMVSERAMHNQRAIKMQKEERKAFLDIKKREMECRERELANQEYRQRQEDIRVKGDGVTMTCDAVTMTDKEKPLEDSTD